MNKYVNTIFISTFVSGIVLTLAPEKSKLKKYLKFITSLISILCIMSPLITFFTNFDNIKTNIQNQINNFIISEKIDASNSLILSTSKEKISENIISVLSNKFDIDENEISIELITDESDLSSIKIEKINVLLSGKASWSDAKKIESYLKDQIGGEINVKRK